MEKWRPVVGFEDRYEVSNMGNVKVVGPDMNGRAYHLGKILRPGIDSNGYPFVNLSSKSIKKKHSSIHVLVMQAFIGPRPKGYDVNHKNGIKGDPRLENLEYMTKSQNARHAIDILGIQMPYGELQANAKFTWDDVDTIRALASSGVKQTEIAKMFGKKSTGLICDIIHMKAWNGKRP